MKIEHIAMYVNDSFVMNRKKALFSIAEKSNICYSIKNI